MATTLPTLPAESMTPEEVAAYSKSITDAINYLNKLPSGQFEAGWEAGKSNWLAGMGAIGGALGFDTEDYVKRQLEDAAFYQQHAPGATSFFGEGGVMDGGTVKDWLVYNFGQSAPYMLEMIGGAGVGGLALKSARGALAARQAVELAGREAVKEQAARATAGEALTGALERQALEKGIGDVAARYAMGAGGALASYPSSVGDILINQHEAGGPYNLGSAMVGGVPYALLNLLGGEAAVGRAMTGGLVRQGAADAAGAAERTLLGRAVDAGKATMAGENLPGAMLRGAGKAGFMEGVGETGQEVVNQMFGRMAVNPNEGLFTGDALMRYAESFMAGLGLGAIPGGGSAVFAKRTEATPDAIAERASQMDRSLEQIFQGNETWREQLDAQTKAAQEQAAAQEAAQKAAQKAEEDAFYKNVQEEQDKQGQLAATLEKLKQEKLKTELQASKLQRDLIKTASEEQPQMDFVQALTGEMRDPWQGLDTGPDATAVEAPAVVITPDTVSGDLFPDLDVTTGLNTAFKNLGLAMESAPKLDMPGLGALSLTDAFKTAHKALQAANAVPQNMEALTAPPAFELTPPAIEYPVEPAAPIANPMQNFAVQQAANHRLVPSARVTSALEDVANQAVGRNIVADLAAPQPGELFHQDNLNRLTAQEEQRRQDSRVAKVEQRALDTETRMKGLEAIFETVKPGTNVAALMNAVLRRAKQPELTPEETDVFKRRAAAKQGFTKGELAEPINLTPEQEVKGRQFGGTELFELGRQDVEDTTETVDTPEYKSLTQELSSAPTVDDALKTLATYPEQADLLAARYNLYMDLFNEWSHYRSLGNEERSQAAIDKSRSEFSPEESIWFNRYYMDTKRDYLARQGSLEFEPTPKRKADATETPETKQAEPTAPQEEPAAAAPTVTPATEEPTNGLQKEKAAQEVTPVVSPRTQALIDRFKKRPKIGAEEARRVNAEQEAQRANQPVDDTNQAAKPDEAVEDYTAAEAPQAAKPAEAAQATETPAPAEAAPAAEDVIASKETTDAVQEQAASEGMPRAEEPAMGLQEVGKRNAKRKAPAAKSEAKKKVATPTMTPTEEIAKIDAQLEKMEAKQEEEYSPSRAETIDRLYDRRNKLEEKQAGMRETAPVEDTVAEAEAEPETDTYGNDTAGLYVEPKDRFDYITGDNPTIASIGITRLLNNGTTADELLTHIINSKASSPVAKVVARLLRMIGVSPTISYEPNNGQFGGNYTNGHVTIYSGGENEHVVLHEILHAATAAKLQRAIDLNQLSDKEFEKLSKTDKELVYAMKKLGRLSAEVQAKFGSKQYGFKTIFEFVAEALSNPELQEMMQQTPSAEKPEAPSMWGEFVRWIKNLLGVVETGSVMERFLEVVPTVMDKRMGKGSFNIALPIEAIDYSSLADMPGAGNATYKAHLAQYLSQKNVSLKERWRAMSETVRNGIAGLQTMRGLAAISHGGSMLVNLISMMANRKQRTLSEWNNQLRKFTDASPEVKQQAMFAIGLAAEHFIEADTTNLYKKYVYGDGVLYTVDPVDGRLKIAEDLKGIGRLTKQQLREGVVLPHREKTKKFAIPNLTDEAYDAYVAAMDTMDNSHLQQIESVLRQMSVLREQDLARLGHTLKRLEVSDDRINAVLQSLQNPLYTMEGSKVSLIAAADLAYQRDVTKAYHDNASQTEAKKAHDKFLSDIYGLYSGEATDNTFEEVAKWLDVSAAELHAAIDNNAFSEKKARDALKQVFSNRATIDKRVVEAKMHAVDSIARAYVPMRHEGRYVIPIRWVDEKGEPAKFDTDELAVGGNLDNIINAEAFRSMYAGDNLEALQAIQKELAAAFKESKFTYTTTDKEGKSVTKTVYLTADEVTEKDIGKKVDARMSPMELLHLLEDADVGLTLDQREKLIKAVTGAESRYRSMLLRKGKLGFNMDYEHVIPKYLTSVGSMLAIREFSPLVNAVMSDEEGKYWRGIDLEPYKQAVADAKAEGNKSLEHFAQQQLDTMRRFDETGRSLNSQHIKGQFQKWTQWVFDTGGEEAKDITTTMRAVTTIMQLGGSFAASFINMASLPLQGLNGLATYNEKNGFGGGFGYAASSEALMKAAKAIGTDMLGASMSHFATGKVKDTEKILKGYIAKAEASASKKYNGYSVDAWKFILREVESGVLQAQQHNQIMSLSGHSLVSSKFGPEAARWMAMFSGTEEFNRMTMALASYELFTNQLSQDKANLDETGNLRQDLREYAEERSVKMVYDTQGEYTMANRPAIFRNGVMSLMFLYKTFAIVSLELLRNMPPQGRAVFLGSLMAMSGLRGLPFYEEFMAVLDGLVQTTGVGRGLTRGNMDSAVERFLREFGMDKVMMNGVLDTVLGTEIFGRAGIKVGVPGIGMLRDGADFYTEMGRTLGAPGGAMEATIRAGKSLAHGDVLGALRNAPVTGVKNLADAYSYVKYENVMNKRGQVVLKDPSPVDVVARVLGFYPEEFTRINRQYGNERLVSLHAKAIHTAFTEENNKRRVLHDYSGMRDLRKDIQEFNKAVKGTGLEFTNYAERLERAGKEAEKDFRTRTLKTMPKAQRKIASEMIEEQ